MLPRTFVACAVNCWMRASSRCTSADSVPWRADSEITRVTLNTVSATMAANATREGPVDRALVVERTR